ncbi:hypothetical protein OUI_0815 [Helicobacter pylori R036d]|uniref:Uncharacterized protein n=1 Tax=Helicobacter pylori R036d TaxID=1145113 RepID=K2JQC4_HELPX|nr:hypothetical protein OUI_0815 [Helicobacter pylori R036d]
MRNELIEIIYNKPKNLLINPTNPLNSVTDQVRFNLCLWHNYNEFLNN